MTYMPVNEDLAGVVPKQMDNSEQAALPCDPPIWCICQMYHSGRGGMPLSAGFV